MATTATQEVPAGPAPRRPTLRLLYSGAAGVFAPPPRTLLSDRVLLGREPAADGGEGRRALSLPQDPRASRHHATVTVSGRGVSVKDEQSKNGTFVNGRQVSEVALTEGDVIRIGDSFLLLRWESAAGTLEDAPIPSLIGHSPALGALRAAISRAAPAMITALLLGESGTGKEVAARALHQHSGRKGPFLAVNCGAIPEELAESQLFGHTAGAFSGARAAHPGFFRAAQGGTLFLDEVGELPQALQPKLLRVLEERAVLPVGAVAPVPCEVRLVAATNRDLAKEVREGRFRGDLYARLCELPLHLSPLRDRREDILPLFLAALGGAHRRAPFLRPRLVAALLAYPFPYNVREVFKVAAQLQLITGDAESVDLDPIAERLALPEADVLAPPPPAQEPEADKAPPTERELMALLSSHRGNVSQLARAVGRSRRQVDRWLVQHGLDPARYRG